MGKIVYGFGFVEFIFCGGGRVLENRYIDILCLLGYDKCFEEK